MWHLTKIIYFSDGASAQYKNKKNFANLIFHNKDFGVPAEWHLFATSHTKGPCNGLGSTIKRFAARTSFTRLKNPINNAKKFPRGPNLMLKILILNFLQYRLMKKERSSWKYVSTKQKLFQERRVIMHLFLANTKKY